MSIDSFPARSAQIPDVDPSVVKTSDMNLASLDAILVANFFLTQVFRLMEHRTPGGQGSVDRPMEKQVDKDPFLVHLYLLGPAICCPISCMQNCMRRGVSDEKVTVLPVSGVRLKGRIQETVKWQWATDLKV